MELYCICVLSLDVESSVDDIMGGSYHFSSFRESCNGISVRHPDLRVLCHAFEKRRVRHCDIKHGTSVFTCNRCIDFSSELMCEVLCAIADSQERQLAFDVCQVYLRGIGIPY